MRNSFKFGPKALSEKSFIFPSLSSQVFWFNGVKPLLLFKRRH